MNFKLRNKSGITLIALIITIIVMLILVGVVVTVVIQSNLLGTAKTAGDKYKTAYEDESNMSEVTINGEKYSSIEDYIEETKPLPEGAGKRAEKTKEYSDGTKTAWIPAGFTVSGIRGETTIEGGLVIYDIPDGSTVDWDNKTIKLPSESETKEIKTAVNQFVWIPVEVNKSTEPTDTETSIASFYRSEWANNARTTVVDSKYTEPYSYDETNDYDASTGIKKQIENLTKSIYKYGGFYIGRYEAGSETERKSSSGKTAIGIKQDMYPYNFVKWGESMSNIGTEGAVVLSNSLYNSMKPNYGATSMLCTGACWDSMLDFIKNTKNVTSSADWGNYSDAEFDITRGKYAEYANRTLGSFTPVDGTYTKKLYSVSKKYILLTTGASERNSAKNIYDVAGNCWEWTTESYSSLNRVYRGRRLQLRCFSQSSLRPRLLHYDRQLQRRFLPPFTLCKSVSLQANW